MSYPDATAKEGASGEHHGLGAVHTAEVGADPCDSCLAGLLWISIHFEAGHHRFAQGQVGGVMQQLQHLPGVMTFVGLGAQGPNRRAAAGI